MFGCGGSYDPTADQRSHELCQWAPRQQCSGRGEEGVLRGVEYPLRHLWLIDRYITPPDNERAYTVGWSNTKHARAGWWLFGVGLYGSTRHARRGRRCASAVPCCGCSRRASWAAARDRPRRAYGLSERSHSSHPMIRVCGERSHTPRPPCTMRHDM
jgi:hypothetical protein